MEEGVVSGTGGLIGGEVIVDDDDDDDLSVERKGLANGEAIMN